MNSLCKLLNIKYPIIQGGLAWIANANLASAVSNAGGLGIISAGNMPVDLLRNEIRKAKEMTDKPLGVNVMLMSPSADEYASLLVEEKVGVVTTGAGSPAKYMSMWKNAGIIVMPVVPSVAMAVSMEKLGADVIIAEGTEAGGHIGETTTMALVPQVVDTAKVPVVAAGGIADGRGIAAAFMLGAVGVQIGTRFLVCDECMIHENYKNFVIKAKDTSTRVTGRSYGRPVRAIRNQFTNKILQLEKSGAPAEEFEYAALGSLKNAVLLGDEENGTFMAGQSAGMVKKKQSIKETINELVDETNKLFGSRFDNL